jgi:hypothetical protein
MSRAVETDGGAEVKILGIDPGEKESGVVMFDRTENRVLWAEHMENVKVEIELSFRAMPDVIVCENIVPMGVPFSRNLRETCRAIDRFELLAQQRRIHWVFITRNEVKVTLCGGCRGIKDANVTTAVQERFGGKKAARGNKKNPGPCYGVSGHCWQALAAVVAACVDM